MRKEYRDIMERHFLSVVFYAKITIFFVLVMISSIIGIVIYPYLLLTKKVRNMQYIIGLIFYFLASRIFGIQIQIENEEKLTDKRGIFLSNHQSTLDVLVLGKIFRPGFTVTSKSSLKYVPFLGWFMLLSNAFFIDRNEKSKAINALQKSLKSLKKEERSLFMFPEGTRYCTENIDILELKKGAFHLAKQTGLPIIPIIVSNTYNVYNYKKKIFSPAYINVKIMDPIYVDLECDREKIQKISFDVRLKMLEVAREVGYSKVKVKNLPDKNK